MHKVIILVADAPTDDLLGTKEAISMVVEGAGRVVRVDVQEIVPEQMRMEGSYVAGVALENGKDEKAA